MKSKTKNKIIVDIGSENIKIIEVEDNHGKISLVNNLLLKTPKDVFEGTVL